MLATVLAFASCSKDMIDFHSEYSVKVPVDITANTKAVIAETGITVADANTATWSVWASNGSDCAQITDATLGDKTYTSQPWVDDPNCMYVLGTKPTMSVADSYYEGKVAGSYSFNSTDGTITATAEADGSYLKPMTVAFYGIYGASVTASDNGSTATTGDSAYEGGNEKVTYTLAWTDAAKKAQYAVAGFAPTFTVADNITVKTTSSTSKSVKATDYPFTIQYIYVGSAKSVVYGLDYNYTPGDAGVTKLGLPKGGVFAGTTLKTVGAVQDYARKSFTTCNETFMTLLPIKSDNVEVTLCCWNCGTKTIYTKSGKSIKPGSWFYIQGTLTKGSSVSNATNPDCEAAGVTGVFMPDVLTKTTINITTLANCESNVTPDPGFVSSFNADVVYGGMTATYSEK